MQKDELSSKCLVYWIHLPEHTDMFTQGYIGITTNTIKKRWDQHKNAAKQGKFTINKAIRKYAEVLVCETILVGSLEYCLDVESKLRSSPCIGWNTATGGQHSNNKFDYTPSETTLQKQSIAMKSFYENNPEALLKVQTMNLGRKHSDTTKEKMSVSRKSTHPWQNSAADPDVWLNAEVFYEYLVNNPKHGVRKMAHNTGVLWSKLVKIHKKLKAGWNPTACQDWQDFHSKIKGKAK